MKSDVLVNNSRKWVTNIRREHESNGFFLQEEVNITVKFPSTNEVLG